MEFFTLTHDDIIGILPERDPNCHKGDCGKLLFIISAIAIAGVT